MQVVYLFNVVYHSDCTFNKVPSLLSPNLDREFIAFVQDSLIEWDLHTRRHQSHSVILTYYEHTRRISQIEQLNLLLPFKSQNTFYYIPLWTQPPNMHPALKWCGMTHSALKDFYKTNMILLSFLDRANCGLYIYILLIADPLLYTSNCNYRILLVAWCITTNITDRNFNSRFNLTPWHFRNTEQTLC